MSTIPEIITAPPSAELREAAARLGVQTLNCLACCHGHADSDGSDGATWYCGMVCSRHRARMDHTYLEDAKVDVEAEKACWEPDFWKANVPAIDAIISHTDASMHRAFKAWRTLVGSVMPKQSGQHRPTNSIGSFTIHP